MITAFVPTLNNEKTIRKVLRAIKNQTIKPKRIIVIDSGSTDDTEKIVKEEGCEFYRPEDFGFKFLGLSRARNRILELIDSEFLLSVDSDILIEKDHIEKLLPILKDKRIAGVAGRQIEFNRLEIGDKARAIVEMDDVRTKSGFKDFLMGSNNIYRVEALKEVGIRFNNNPFRPFDDELTTNYEDVLVGERLRSLGYKLYLDSNVNTYHLQKDSLISFIDRAYRYRVFKWIRKGAFESFDVYRGKIEHNINYVKKFFNVLSKEAKADLAYVGFLSGIYFFVKDIEKFLKNSKIKEASIIYISLIKAFEFLDDEIKKFVLEDINLPKLKIGKYDKEIFNFFKDLFEFKIFPKKFPSIYEDFNKDVDLKKVIKASKIKANLEKELKIYDDFRVMLVNLPWIEGNRKGVRAGSRWPHTYLSSEKVLRYVPYPFFLSYAHYFLQEEGIASYVLDSIAEGYNEEEAFYSIVGYEPNLLVVETSTPTYENDLQFLKKIKEFNRNIKICLVGTHISFVKEKALEYDFIDFVIEGEFEKEVVKLAKELKQNSVSNKYKTSDGWDFSKAKRYFEILPFYNYNDRPIKKLKYPSFQIQLTRGCPYKCIFCMWPQLLFKGYQKRNLDIVIDEIKRAKDIFGINSFYVDDDTFNIDKNYILEFAKRLKKEKINLPFMVMARADAVVEREIIKELKEAGLEAIKFGIESVDENILKEMNKSLNLKKSEESIKICKELGVEVHLTFSIGSFSETKESIKKTFLWLIKQNPDSMQISILTPFPATKMWYMAKELGYKLDNDFKKYDGARYCVVASKIPKDELVKIKENWIKEWNNFKKTGNYSLEFLE